jgi:hypothetical protein
VEAEAQELQTVATQDRKQPAHGLLEEILAVVQGAEEIDFLPLQPDVLPIIQPAITVRHLRLVHQQEPVVVVEGVALVDSQRELTLEVL